MTSNGRVDDTLRMLSNCIAMSIVFFLGHPWKHHGHILLDSFHLLHPRKVSTFSPWSSEQISSTSFGSIAAINFIPITEGVPNYQSERFCTYLQHCHDQVCGSAGPRHCPPWCCSHQDERQRACLSQVLPGETFFVYQVGGYWAGICILVVRLGRHRPPWCCSH